MENPYAAPSADLSPPDERRRPFGVAILAVLSGVFGLVYLAAVIGMLMDWRSMNEFALRQRMAPSVLWFCCGVLLVAALAGSIGMWRGARWGWWIACGAMVMTCVQNAISVLIVNLSRGSPSVATLTSIDSIKYTLRGIIAALVLAYLLRNKVRRYYRLEQTSRIKAVMLAAVCGFGTMIIVISVLQLLFLFRTR
jgi:hypothetical protein